MGMLEISMFTVRTQGSSSRLVAVGLRTYDTKILHDRIDITCSLIILLVYEKGQALQFNV